MKNGGILALAEARNARRQLPKITHLRFLLLLCLALSTIFFVSALSLAQEKSAKDWMERGFELSRNGSYREAVQAFEVAAQIDPGNKEAWINKAAALDRIREHDLAVASYLKALEIVNRSLDSTPQDSNAWVQKGLLLHNVDLHEQAVRAFENATAIDSQNEMAWKMMGVILASELERYAQANEAFDRALEINPSDPRTWQAKGDAQKALGQQAGADAAYTRAKELESP